MSDIPNTSDPSPKNEPSNELVAEDPSEEQTEESSGNLSFALLAFALLLMVGASVYFVGTLLTTTNETTAAEQRAAAQIAEFESAPPTIGSTPSTLPLTVEDEPNAVEATNDDPTASTEEAESDRELDETEAPFPNVNPNDIGIAFVNRTPGDDYGTIGYIDREGIRHTTTLECVRIDLNANGGICLDDTSGLGGSGRGLILDANLNPSLRFGINLPSRAAASPDGSVVAWTGFAVGHSYLNPGEFATTTQLIEVERGIGANLETQFVTFGVDNQPIETEERNYWGVTFVDDDTFYATLGVGDDTSIVEGSISTSRLQVIHDNATCPEVSPDGSTIVAKERRGDVFQVVAIDTATGERRDLPETRSVEDQVEFLDDSTILYGLPNEAEGTEAQPAWDVWSLDLNGGTPQLIIPFADSPAAI